MRIRTVRVRGAPPEAPLQADFGAHGGSIGRGSHCTLVLPDPYKHVSRTHAEIAEVDGRWLLTDRGSANAVVRNGQEVGRDRQVPLADGDMLVIGDYELQVELAEPAPLAAPSGAGIAAAPLPPTQFWNSLLPESRGPDPLADLLASDAPGERCTDPPGGVPDPFAPDPRTRILSKEGIERDLAPEQPALGTDVAAGLDSAAPESLDDWFDLAAAGSPMAAEPLPGDPSSGSPQHDDQGADPIEALGLGRSPPAPAAPLPDAAPSWQQSFSVASRSAPDAPQHPSPISDERLRVIVGEAVDAQAGSFEPLPRTQPTELIEAINRQGSAAAALQAASGAATPPPEALLAQLLAGLQMPGLPQALGDNRPRQFLDVHLMRRLGELLRLSLQGLLALLAARSAVKHEMRASATVISERANNPLKFSPDVLSALTHLLAPQPTRGFMDPAAAVQEACDDLLAHQLAHVAATRAALQQLLERFDPARLEARLSGNRRMLDALVPGARKARLWELYGELFAQISREAEDDFESLFGKAFRVAYEAQLVRLREAGEKGDER